MSMTKQTYSAPKLTYYGKLAELTQAGSTLVIEQDVTGDGTPETFLDIDGDGLPDVAVIGGIGTQISLTKISEDGFPDTYLDHFYDSNDDGGYDIVFTDGIPLGVYDGIIDGSYDVYLDMFLWDNRDGQVDAI